MISEAKTLNGKFNARCQHCMSACYSLWVSDEPPPAGCAEGHDADISMCGHVYTVLIFAVANQDVLEKPLTEIQQFIIGLLGPKADQIMADIRAGKEPPHHRPLPPIYDRPQLRN